MRNSTKSNLKRTSLSKQLLVCDWFCERLPCKVFFIGSLTFLFPGSSCVKMVIFFIWKHFLFCCIGQVISRVFSWISFSVDWFSNWRYGDSGSQCFIWLILVGFFSIRICNVVTNFVTTLQTKNSTSYKTSETCKIIKQSTSLIKEPYTLLKKGTRYK